MSCRFIAMTVTNDPTHPGAERLRRSAKYWGWDLKWFRQDTFDRSTFREQQLAQLDAILQYEPDFLLYLDAWDTIFCGPPQELQLTPGVLTFGGDTVLTEGWANAGQAVRISPDEFPQVPSGGFRFINDGTLWGDAKIISELAKDYLENYEKAINQDYFNKRLVFEHSLYRKRLQVDFEARVSINIMDVQRRHVERLPNNRLIYLPFRTTPLILHSPGTYPREPLAPVPHWMEEIFCAE